VLVNLIKKYVYYHEICLINAIKYHTLISIFNPRLSIATGNLKLNRIDKASWSVFIRFLCTALTLLILYIIILFPQVKIEVKIIKIKIKVEVHISQI
jgi:hypothetical protein